MFVADDRVPVTLDGVNTIYILTRMNLGIRNKFIAAIEAAKAQGSVGVGTIVQTLMHTYVLGWSGPAFEGVEFTPENIDKLDPDEPLVNAVLLEAGTRANQMFENQNGITPPEVTGGDGDVSSTATSPTRKRSGALTST